MKLLRTGVRDEVSLPGRNAAAATPVRAPERLNPVQLWVIGLCLAVLMLDGLDLQLLALAAPKIVTEYRIDVRRFAPALTAALVGMALGNLAGGPLGDRFGRRPLLFLSVSTFGASTLAAAFTRGVVDLAAVRFVCGLGFGASIPNAMALTSEWVPGHHRAKVISLLGVGTPAGGMIGAAAIGPVLRAEGWRTGFVISGVITITLALLVLWRLPESLAFLARKGSDDAADRLLDRASGRSGEGGARRRFELGQGEIDPLDAGDTTTPTVERYFDRSLVRTHFGLTLAFFANLYACYAIINWLPTATVVAGASFDEALRASFAYNAASIGGAFIATQLLALLNSRAAGTLLIGVSAAAVFGLMVSLTGSGHPGGAVLVAAIAAGLGMGAVQATFYTIAAQAYAPGMRATGIGAATAAGRVGGIVATLLGGIVLVHGRSGLPPFFLSVLLAIGVAGVGVLIVNRHSAASRRI